ncbi:MAG: GNAT family N-acetyltransferase [Alphaproteobacteria bacterium]|nr:GNAT family N-acetyltransferase [Alphaproteobacteria bacterium]
MGADWSLQRVALPFRIGDMKLGRAVLSLLVCDSYFMSRRGGLPPLPAAPLPPGCDGCLLRSQPVTDVATGLSRWQGWLRYVPQVYGRQLVDLHLGLEAYMARFSGKTRSTLLRKLRRFEAEAGGPADMRVYRTADELAEFHAVARELSARTYQERLLDAGLPDDARFVAEMRRLGEAGRAWGFLLFLHGRPVAYIFCPAEADALLYAYVGFDPAAAPLSPGTVLQLLALRVLFADGGFRWFDFTEGEGPHKALFATEQVQCADIYLLRPTLANTALVRARLAVEGAGAAAGALLERLGVKRAVKRWLRRGATSMGEGG